jgi:putative heme iron utilization protein
MSGLRFVRQAAQADKRVLIINRDPTRGDQLAHSRVSLPLGTALSSVADALNLSADGQTALGPDSETAVRRT